MKLRRTLPAISPRQPLFSSNPRSAAHSITHKTHKHKKDIYFYIFQYTYNIYLSIYIYIYMPLLTATLSVLSQICWSQVFVLFTQSSKRLRRSGIKRSHWWSQTTEQTNENFEPTLHTHTLCVYGTICNHTRAIKRWIMLAMKITFSLNWYSSPYVYVLASKSVTRKGGYVRKGGREK